MAGIRTPQELTIKARKSHGSDLPSLEEVMPSIFQELEKVRHQLENHYTDMQDIELLGSEQVLFSIFCVKLSEGGEGLLCADGVPVLQKVDARCCS